MIYPCTRDNTKATRKHNLAKTTSIKANTHVAGHAVICWKYKLEGSTEHVINSFVSLRKKKLIV